MEKVIFVQGPPGAGKSTLARKAISEHSISHSLHEHLPVRFLPVGAHVRGVLSGELPSRFAGRVQQEGEAVRTLHLPSPELVYTIVEDCLTMDSDGVTIVDGFPRDMELLDMLRASEKAGTLQVLGNVTVDVPDDVSIARQMARESVDGHPACDVTMALRRTTEYRRITEPVVRAVSTLWGGEVIDGQQSISVAGPLFTAALRRTLAR